MAKFEQASEDVEKLFDEVRNNTSIPHWVEFRVLCNNKQKGDPCKIFKTNDLIETLTEGVNFAVVFNEKIFTQLPEDMQIMAIDECLAGVGISDSDALSLEKPNFNTHTGVLQKYGHDPIIRLKESVKSLYDSEKQKEEQEKSERKGKRGRKPKQ